MPEPTIPRLENKAMAMVGADIAALRGFANALLARRARIDETVRDLTSTIEGLNWVGNDRERFVSDWSQIHRPGLLQIVADLQDSSAKVMHYAANQEHASQ
jgi:uncharacterized protein YukE